jgi:hypothetical protein
MPGGGKCVHLLKHTMPCRESQFEKEGVGEGSVFQTSETIYFSAREGEEMGRRGPVRLSYYGIRQSILDRATLEVYYELRTVPLETDEKNVCFEQMCDEMEVEDEEEIDTMPHRRLGKLTFWGNFWGAITAHSHRPAYPAEIGVSSQRERTSVYHAFTPGEFSAFSACV